MKHKIIITILFILSILVGTNFVFSTYTYAQSRGFYVELDENAFFWKRDSNTIVAVQGNKVAEYKFEGEFNGLRRYKQQQNYYGSGSVCSSHLDVSEQTPKGSDNYGNYWGSILYEDKSAVGCNDSDRGNPNIHLGVSNDIAIVAKAYNYGKEPLGCEGFGSLPSGNTSANYNCPNGGSIVNGAYSTNSIDVPTPGSGEETSDDACLSTGGVFAWAICAVGDLASQAIKVMDDLMYSLLSIPIDQWGNSGAKTVWSSMVLIASSLIVLITLVGIASQVFNFDFVSAYTIRKILPKLFIGAIAIQLSWFLGTVMINISNDIGYGTQALITAPFENAAKNSIKEKQGLNDDDAAKIKIDNEDNGWVSFAEIMNLYYVNADHPQAASVGLTSGLFAGILATGIAIKLGALVAPAVISTLALGLITALIAILVAFIVIALRYVLVLGLLIIMPLAIAAWILPSTKKWFDRWWDMFFALLAMFPIIIAFLSFGKVAAIIIAMSAS